MYIHNIQVSTPMSIYILTNDFNKCDQIKSNQFYLHLNTMQEQTSNKLLYKSSPPNKTR